MAHMLGSVLLESGSGEAVGAPHNSNSLNWLIVGIVVLMVVRMGLRNHLYIRAHTVGPCHYSDRMMHVWQTR